MPPQVNKEISAKLFWGKGGEGLEVPPSGKLYCPDEFIIEFLDGWSPEGDSA